VRNPFLAAVLTGWLLLAAGNVGAHFQVLLPETEIMAGESRPINLDLRFTHPATGGPAMAMGPPAQFGVLFNGRRHDLRQALRPVAIDGKSAFRASYLPGEPADYIFYIEPAPYWEPAEEKMIIHYTKVVVDGFGAEDGWDALVGLPVEIEPLVRPYGLWAGNVFRGLVRRNGQPVPHATIEVAYYNDRQQLTIPAEAFATQVLKADAQGVFCYGLPVAGWWGFAALSEGEEKLVNPAGQPVPVELGGLLWVRAHEPIIRRPR
jgi:cobalt/nickel transport protein